MHISFVNCTFANNNSPTVELFRFSNTFVEMNSCSFINNSANNFDYSGIYVYNTDLAMTSSTFRNQTSKKYGAFLYATGNSNLVINEVLFSQGQANFSGGAIYINGGTLQINSSIFEENVGVQSGGGIYGMDTTLTITNTSFTGGDSVLGDAIYLDSSTLQIDKSQFTSSKTKSQGPTASVYTVGTTSINVTNSLFALSKGSISGIMANGAVSVIIVNSTFQNITSLYYGALTCIGGQVRGSVTVIGSIFIDNYSTGNGAGVHIENMDFLMIESTVQGNTALVDGGGMYLATPTCNTCSFSVIGMSTFMYNHCTGEGGAIKWRDYKPTIEASVIMENNTAAYGGDIASFPCSLNPTYRRLLTDSADYIIFAAAPGQVYTNLLSISLYDTYGKILTADNTSTLVIQSIKSYPDLTFRGNTSFTCVKGVFSLSDFIPDGPPGSTQRFIASTPSISNSAIPNDLSTYNNSVVIEIFLRNCTNGEQVSVSQCIPCKEYTFLIEPTFMCNTCPTGGICPGGAVILPKPGYWRSSSLSEIVYACPCSEACIGNTTEFDYQGGCSEGYYGVMCNTCKAGYTRAGSSTCIQCPSTTNGVLLLLFIISIVLILAIALVKSSIKSAFSPKALHSIYIKILTNYLQLMFLTAQFEFNWPSYVLQLLNAQKVIVSSTDSIFSIDCYLRTSASSRPEDSYYYKIILITLMPIILFIVSFIIWVGICFTKETYSYLKRELFLTMIIVFFLVYPNISMICFANFSCIYIDKLGYYLKNNYAIECSGERYTQYYLIVVFPSIVVWIVGLPAIILAAMIKRKRFLHQDYYKVVFGFLFNGYKKSIFFWEFGILYRKVLIISIVTFFTNVSTLTQAVSILLLLNLSIFLHLKLRPYVSNELNNMEMQALVTSAVTLYCGVYFLAQDLGSTVKMLLFTIILMGNMFFIIYWAYWMWLALLDIIVKYIPHLRYIFSKGDAYEMEYYQEKISKPGSYFEIREGDRLCTYMKIYGEVSPNISFKIQNMDQLFKDTLEYESFQNRSISLGTVKEVEKEEEIEEAEEDFSKDILDSNKKEAIIGYWSQEISNEKFK